MDHDETLRNESESFFEKHNLNPVLNCFCRSEVIQQTVREYYPSFKTGTKVLLSKAPHKLRKKAEAAISELEDYSFEDYMEDFRVNMAMHIYSCAEPMLKLCDTTHENTIADIVRQSITVKNDGLVKTAKKFLGEIANTVSKITVGDVFKGYIPAGIPKEVEAIVKRIAGENGYIIPGQIFMDYLDDMANPGFSGERGEDKVHWVDGEEE